jgi:hypothetical protein
MSNPMLDLIRSFSFLNIEQGPWVAGGAVRRLLSDDFGAGDIDIFLPERLCGFWNDQKCNLTPLVDRIDNIFHEQITSRTAKKNLNEYVFGLNKPFNPNKIIKVQVVHKNRFDSIEALLSDFDFTICMAATDGWRWVAYEQIMSDIERRQFGIQSVQRRGMEIRRMIKYCNFGLTPKPGVLSSVLSRETLDTVLDDELMVDYSKGAVPDEY